MREIFFKIFGEHEATDLTKISMFSWHHILYLVLIVGIIVALGIIFFKKEHSTRSKLLNIIAIIIAVCYLGDFFLQPFRNGGTLENNAEIILDKFPFHICVVLCPLILYSRFAKFGKVLKTPCAIAASVAPLMWLVYPGTALDTNQSAFSYEIIQLFAYHGLIFIYGSLFVLLRDEELNIKKCYKEAILVIGIALWATLGNTIYSSENHSYNWFFLKDPVFGFIPEAINPFVVVIAVYAACLLVYGIHYLVLYLYNKYNKKLISQ